MVLKKRWIMITALLLLAAGAYDYLCYSWFQLPKESSVQSRARNREFGWRRGVGCGDFWLTNLLTCSWFLILMINHEYSNEISHRLFMIRGLWACAYFWQKGQSRDTKKTWEQHIHDFHDFAKSRVVSRESWVVSRELLALQPETDQQPLSSFSFLFLHARFNNRWPCTSRHKPYRYSWSQWSETAMTQTFTIRDLGSIIHDSIVRAETNSKSKEAWLQSALAFPCSFLSPLLLWADHFVCYDSRRAQPSQYRRAPACPSPFSYQGSCSLCSIKSRITHQLVTWTCDMLPKVTVIHLVSTSLRFCFCVCVACLRLSLM